MSRRAWKTLATVLTLIGAAYLTAGAISRTVEVGNWAMFLMGIAVTVGLVGAALWCALRLRTDRDEKAGLS